MPMTVPSSPLIVHAFEAFTSTISKHAMRRGGGRGGSHGQHLLLTMEARVCLVDKLKKSSQFFTSQLEQKKKNLVLLEALSGAPGGGGVGEGRASFCAPECILSPFNRQAVCF